MAIEYLDVVEATYAPKVTHDLTLRARQSVGWRGLWCAAWIIEEGPYTGQRAFITHEEDAPPLGWVPESDLADVRAVNVIAG